jgi:hypothetical protein
VLKGADAAGSLCGFPCIGARPDYALKSYRTGPGFGAFEVAALRPVSFCCSQGLYAHVRRSTIFRG